MDTRKICLLGAYAVGKTSLVARFVQDRFSRHYLTTIGVKVDSKTVIPSQGEAVRLAVWDLGGTGAPTGLFLRYLRGASGYLLVVDGTRAQTLDRALELRQAVESNLDVLPFVGLVNKSDLIDAQEVTDAQIKELTSAGGVWLRTSARQGQNVDRAFGLLVALMDEVQ